MEEKKVDMIGSECAYPECEKEERIVFKIKVNNEENAYAELPFCWYHYYCVASNLFTCDRVDETKFVLKGPFEQVALIEAVEGAKLMVEEILKKNGKV